MTLPCVAWNCDEGQFDLSTSTPSVTEHALRHHTRTPCAPTPSLLTQVANPQRVFQLRAWFLQLKPLCQTDLNCLLDFGGLVRMHGSLP